MFLTKKELGEGSLGWQDWRMRRGETIRLRSLEFSRMRGDLIQGMLFGTKISRHSTAEGCGGQVITCIQEGGRYIS